MVALRICVLVYASTKQFQDKSVFIRTVSVTSSNLKSMFQDNPFKSTKTSDISNAMVKIVPLDNS